MRSKTTSTWEAEMRRRLVEFVKQLPLMALIVSAAIAGALGASPGLGTEQPMLVGMLLLASYAWWRSVPDGRITHFEPSRLHLAMACVPWFGAAACAFRLGRDWEHPFGEPALYWMAFGLLAPVLLLRQAARGVSISAGRIHAIILGLGTTAVWISIVRAIDMGTTLRWHPYSLYALGMGALFLLGIDTVRRGTEGARAKFAMFAFAQTVGVLMYGVTLTPLDRTAYGELEGNVRLHIPGRDIAVGVQNHGATRRVYAHDRNNDDTVMLAHIPTSYRDLSIEARGDAISVSWLERPSSAFRREFAAVPRSRVFAR